MVDSQRKADQKGHGRTRLKRSMKVGLRSEDALYQSKLIAVILICTRSR